MPKYKIGKYTQKQIGNTRTYKRKRKYNKTSNGTLTIRQKNINEKRAIITIAVVGVSAITYAFMMLSNHIIIDSSRVEAKAETIKQVNQQPKAVKMYREITAYNAGDPYQCDNTPCISASGDNICNLLAKGQNVCATNLEPIGTILEIEGLGECIVLDRMNSRFTNRIDWAMEAHEKPQAIAFGLKTLSVKIIK